MRSARILAPRGMSYALYRCTHPPCPGLVEEATIGIPSLFSPFITFGEKIAS